MDVCCLKTHLDNLGQSVSLDHGGALFIAGIQTLTWRYPMQHITHWASGVPSKDVQETNKDGWQNSRTKRCLVNESIAYK